MTGAEPHFKTIQLPSESLDFDIPDTTKLPAALRSEITQRLEVEFDEEFARWTAAAAAPDASVLARHHSELQQIEDDRQSQIRELQRIIDTNQQKRRDRAAEVERFEIEEAALSAEIVRLNSEIEAIQNRHREEEEQVKVAVAKRRTDLRAEKVRLADEIRSVTDRRSQLERDVNELNATVAAEGRRRESQRKGVAGVRDAIAKLLAPTPFSLVTLVKCLGDELNAVNKLRRAKDGLEPFVAPTQGEEIVLTDESARMLIREPGLHTLQRTYEDLEKYYEWKVTQLLGRI
jgi:chromosome segregation ATPase